MVKGHMKNVTEKLSESDAMRILMTIEKHRSGATESRNVLDGSLKEALGKAFDVRTGGERVSDGEMARHALALLAQEPEMNGIIESMAKNPPAVKLEAITAIVLTAAVVMALKTHIEIKRNEKGEWTFHVKSRASDKETLKMFLEKLLSWVPEGPFR